MYQITAVYMGSEIAYSEGEEFSWVRSEVLEQVQESIYAEVLNDVMLECISPDGMRVFVPAVL